MELDERQPRLLRLTHRTGLIGANQETGFLCWPSNNPEAALKPVL